MTTTTPPAEELNRCACYHCTPAGCRCCGALGPPNRFRVPAMTHEQLAAAFRQRTPVAVNESLEVMELPEYLR